MTRLIFLISCVFLIFTACDKPSQWAKIENIRINHLTTRSVVIRCQIGEGVSNEYGLIYSTKEAPTLQDSIVLLTGNRNNLIGYVDNLSPNQTYFFKVFLKKGNSIIYSEQHEIHTPIAQYITDDRDGNIYETVVIGNQTWMAENLRYQTRNSVFYNLDSITFFQNGRLYPWEEAQNACPIGWHLPSDKDWKELESFIGVTENEIDIFDRTFMNTHGINLLNFDFSLHISDNLTNEYAFNALPTGTFSKANHKFYNMGITAHYWSSSTVEISDSSKIIIRTLDNIGSFNRIKSDRNNLYAIRCVKD